jgi:hypothetical protein
MAGGSPHFPAVAPFGKLAAVCRFDINPTFPLLGVGVSPPTSATKDTAVERRLSHRMQPRRVPGSRFAGFLFGQLPWDDKDRRLLNDSEDISLSSRQTVRKEVIGMNPTRIVFLCAVLISAVTAIGQTQPPQPPQTIASMVDRQLSAAEKLITDAAEAMPEDKFNFSPETLSISGADYKGVRTFALQVKHVAASNYALFAPLTGDTFPKDFLGGNGPENLKTKADIMKFLHDSFTLGHKAAATLTTDNMLQFASPGGSTTRLHRAAFAVAHAYDHYGQMVEYLRMNGIVPPASRGKSD